MEQIEEATTSKPSEIQRVSKETVLKICSAQVILNLGIAVKELVENSVDAGATVIEIRIKEYGLEGFDVIDNGSGVEEADFTGITAKHCTSKLKQFSDLEQIKTFGFRGEALSSLCALSDVSITTRHSSVEYGTKLEFNHDGTILKKTMSARNVGTTVSVTNFFKTLPVRKIEFQKNHRKDFSKMVQLLQEYCLVLTGIKIICTNKTKNGSRQPVISTNGNTIMENIISIFGVKQSQELIRIKAPTDDGTDGGSYTQESLLDIDTEIKDVQIESLNRMKFRIFGYISNIDHKCGRTSKDRQYFYVNSRPVELKSVAKIVNDTYHHYNLKQFPFVFINLVMQQSNVDINLSKDKRQVAVVDDSVLQLVVKKSLLNTFGDLPSKFKYSSVNSVMKHFNQQNGSEEDTSSEEDEDDKVLMLEPNSNFGASLKQWKINPSDPFPSASTKRKLESQRSSQMEKLPKIDMFVQKFSKQIESDEERDDEKENSNNSTSSNFSRFKYQSAKNDVEPVDSIGSVDEFVIKADGLRTSTQESFNIESFRIDCREGGNSPKFDVFQRTNSVTDDSSLNSFDSSNTLKEPDVSLKIDCKFVKPDSTLKFERVSSVEKHEDENFSNSLQSSGITLYDAPKSFDPAKQKFKVSIDQIKRDAIQENTEVMKLKEEESMRSFKLKFKESIDPSKNKVAEAELETEIKKSMFADMTVIGQFNLGFIIAKLESDLFIVDQHATDERYNFETLEKSLKIESQKMINPEKLELTAIQEETIIENLDIFEMNGFKFDIDGSAMPTQRIKLLSRPYSKSWEFGKEDIEEMIFMLQDAPKAMCRPSRIIKMLASRACRKSVMIGDALDQRQMKTLLTHMGEIDHPWNCPHGRPTIRFLQNMHFIDTKKDD